MSNNWTGVRVSLFAAFLWYQYKGDNFCCVNVSTVADLKLPWRLKLPISLESWFEPIPFPAYVKHRSGYSDHVGSLTCSHCPALLCASGVRPQSAGSTLEFEPSYP